MNQNAEQEPRDLIAVIGMAGRFPGADNLHEFWRNLRNGVESIRPFTPEELVESGVDPEVLNQPNYVNAGAPLEGADCFDAEFFGFTPKEAELLDPQHRLFLECAWNTLEDAGYDSERYTGPIGVFGGVARNTYFLRNVSTYRDLMASGALYQATLASEKDFPATRVSYKLDLTGPSINLQLACSTSGVATHLACQSLLNGESEMALVGGVRIQVPMKAGYAYVDGGILSPDGCVRAFDANARGCVVGNGVGMILLKPAEEALRDGDAIYAMIIGSAINNDGASKIGFTAPSVAGQASVIAEAQAMAEVEADTISYIETHGTGTTLGDPIEIAALTNAFRKSTDRRGFCRIGSVKTNIGHLDAGAGVAGIIKTALSLKKREIPPSLNFETGNPEIDFEHSPFLVNHTLTEWEAGTSPRRAGVSSFGIGGTNAHILLEEAPVLTQSPDARPWKLLPLSARTDTALDAMARNLAAHLRTESESCLADVAYTLQVGRKRFPHRRILVSPNLADAAEVFEVGDPERTLSAHLETPKTQIAFMFPGQGAQHVNMGREVYDHESVFRREVDRCADLLVPLLGEDIRTVLFPAVEEEAAATERLTQTAMAQPALFLIEYALAQLWMDWGVKPAAMIGHSIGEFVAAALAGVFSLEDALTVVVERAKLMQAQPAGSMLSVRLPEDEASAYVEGDVTLAASNTPQLCVLSGPSESIAKLATQLEADGVQARPLHTSHAFHSVMMQPAVAPFTACVASVDRNPPQFPMISSLTGTWLSDEQAIDPSYWAEQLRHGVRFSDGICALQEKDDFLLLEVGPGRTLCTLARQNAEKPSMWTVIGSLQHVKDPRPSDAAIMEAVGKIWLAGIEPDWTRFHGGASRSRVNLPTYPFERKRYWLPSREGLVDALGAQGPGDRLSQGSLDTEPQGSYEPMADVAEEVADVSDDRPRKDLLLEQLKEILYDLSGVEVSDMDDHSSFLEMGFDSLFLTRATTAFQQAFSVSINFRQLFDEAPTPDRLAAYIDHQLGDVPDEVRVVSSPVVSHTEEGPVSEDVTLSSKGHGPWKPLDAQQDADLTAHQRKHLDALIDRYTSKTEGSKRLTQSQRQQLADPRAVTGFRSLWKEMVYQIAFTRSSGSKIWDVDGNEYVDLIMGFGINLFGHSPDFIRDAVETQLHEGYTLGLLTPLAKETADLICEVAEIERVNFVNTGSEAVAAAVRAARTVTGRDLIAVFEGDYHGIADELLVRSVERNGQQYSQPISPGIPNASVSNVIVLNYDDPTHLDTIRKHARELAGVVVEPIPASRPNRLLYDEIHALREVTQSCDVPLIFDELITAFRIHPRGAQGWYGVDADLVAYGKVLSGGLPLAAVGGKARFMDAFDGGAWQYGDDSFPEKGVTFFGGTFVRHPLSLASARAQLLALKEQGPQLQEELNRRTAEFVTEIDALFRKTDAPMRVMCGGSMFVLSVTDTNPLARLVYFYLREKGVHLTERAGFLSTAHTDEDLSFVLCALEESIRDMREAHFFAAPRERSEARQIETEPIIAQAISKVEQDAVPLTLSQEEIWLASTLDNDLNCSYNLSNALDLTGHLDIECMRHAVHSLVQRHEALRTVVRSHESVQEVLSDVTIELPTIDLSTFDKTERQAKLAVLRDQEVSEAFDLATGPLVKAKILKLGSEHHLLFLTVHHIVCDGYSCGTLLKDLCDLYAAAVSGQSYDAPPPMQLRPYVMQQLWLEEGPMALRDEAYWLAQLSENITVLDVPSDRPRPPVKTYCASRIQVALDPVLGEELKQLASAHGCTLFMMMYAAFVAYMHRITGQRDVIIGIAKAGQPMEDGRDVVAHTVNLLPVRIQVDPEASFFSHLDVVKRKVLDAFEHRNCTFGTLVKKLKTPRDSSRLPLVSVVFNMDLALGSLGLPDLEVQAGSNARKFDHFEWFFNFLVGEGSMRFECTYNKDLFSEEIMMVRLREFETFLKAVSLEKSDRELDSTVALSLSRLPLWSPSERKAILGEPNATDADYPSDMCVHQLFEQQVNRSPESVAAIIPAPEDESAEEQVLTYTELDQRSNRLAHYLLRQGLKRGAFVGLFLDRTEALLVGLLGILKAGGAYLPLSHMFPKERLEWMLTDSEAAMVLTEEKGEALLPKTNAVLLCLDRERQAISSESKERPNLELDAEQPAYVIYTSGSTGRPKGVEIPHRCVNNFLSSMAKCPGFSTEDRLLAVTTLSFDISVLEIFLPLVCGGQVVVASHGDGMDGTRLKELLERYDITVMQATPSTWRLLLLADWTGKSDLRILCGGEAMPRDLVGGLLARCVSLWNMYGPTETTIWSSVKNIESEDHLITIGRPIDNTQIYILDENLQPVPVGVTGELVIGGHGLAKGYLRRPGLTEEKFIHVAGLSGEATERVYRTGDLGRYRLDGDIECLGRRDFQIKLRGFRIELEEIEAVLGEDEAIRESAAAMVDMGPGDQRLAAYYVLHEGASVSDVELRNHLRNRLAEYMVPQHVIALDRLPRLPNGKLDRKSLPAPDGDSLRPGHEYVAPRTPTEKTLVEMWTSLLKVKRIGIHDNFFDVGGHSLLAMKILVRTREVFGIELSLREVLEATTVAMLAEQIVGRSPAVDHVQPSEHVEPLPNIRRIPRDQPIPLSQAQERLWYLEQLEPGTSVYNIADGFRLKGKLDVASLNAAIGDVIARHEALRTSIGMHQDQPVQVISERIDTVWPMIDLSHEPAEAREGTLHEQLQKDARQPFDLAKGPLSRGVIYSLGREDYVVMLMVHHIVCDGWSIDNFWREVGAIYRARLEGKRARLPKLSVQYADYAVWSREWMKGPWLEKSLAYWKAKLGGTLPALELPTKARRPAHQTYLGSKETTTIPAPLVESLTQIGREENATLFMVLLTAYKVLIARYTGQDDVIIGSPVANRYHEQTEPAVGLFANTLVLRTSVQVDGSFRDALQSVRSVCLGAFEHQEMPFEKIVQELNPERDLSRTPIFQAMFSLWEKSDATLDLSGITSSSTDTHMGVSRTDLSLWATDTGEGVAISLEYSTDLFESEFIAAFLEHYLTLLSEVVDHVDASLSRLPLLSAAEREAILGGTNATDADYPSEVCIHQLFEQQVSRSPKSVAAIIPAPEDKTAEEVTLTYAELDQRSNRLAHYLLRQGLKRGTLVGLFLDRTEELLVGLLGILKAGGAYLPLSPMFPKERLEWMLTDSQAEMVLTEEKGEALLPKTDAVLLYLDREGQAISSESKENPNLELDAEQPAYVIYTSGSTGRPKGVEIPHRCVNNFLSSMAKCPGFLTEDRLLALTTLSFDISVLEIFLPLVRGGQVVVASHEDGMDGTRLKELLEHYDITVMQATPSTWRLLVLADWAGKSNLRILCGGEAMPKDLVGGLVPHCASLWNMYGPTETTIWSSVKNIESPEHLITIGRPIDNTQIYILDENMQPVPMGVTGELYIGGHGLAKGYLRRPELTEEKFIHVSGLSNEATERVYRTGDVGRYLSNGDIECLGRRDFQIKLRGFRIELGEIESVLNEQESVGESAATVVEMSPGDQRLAAYYVLREGASVSDLALRSHLRTRLPEYMVPQHFVSIGELPLTPSGKVDRKSLPPLSEDEGGAGVHLKDRRSVVRRPLIDNLEEERLTLLEVEAKFQDRVGVKRVEDYPGLQDDLDRLCTAYLVDYFKAASVEMHAGASLSMKQLQEKLEVQPAFHKFVDYMCSLLEKDHVLSRDVDTFTVLPSVDEVPLPKSLHDAAMATHPKFKGLLRLLEHCVSQFADALSGRIPSITVLFPDGTRNYLDQCLVEETVEHDNIKVYQEVARELILRKADDGPIHILEVGGGGGMLTWMLAEDLKDKDVQYTFTDIGKTMVYDAKKRAEAEGYDFLTSEILDISQPPEGQNFGNRTFDIIVGLNVVHATADLDQSLGNLKKLLAAEGFVCLIELVQSPRWDNLIWGTTGGWWLFDDAYRDKEPLVSLDTWERAFQKQRFVQVASLPSGAAERSRTDSGIILGTLTSSAVTVDDPLSDAPIDFMEQQLVHVWSSVLHIKSLGRHDNFFELGGHSFLALQLVTKLEKLYRRRLPLATLLEAPTVAELADVLRKKNWTPDWSSLVPIRPQGTLPPLFLMHAHGGNVLGYHPLAKYLHPDQPVYALQAQGLNGTPSKHKTIEDMATHYISEMKTLQPKGPYYVGGFCMGGIIGLEVAQQLQEAGDEVGLLILINTEHYQYRKYPEDTRMLKRRLYSLATRLRIEVESMKMLPAQEIWRYEKKRLYRFHTFTQARLEAFFATLLGRGEAGDSKRSAASAVDAIHAVNYTALIQYRPKKPYEGPVTLLSGRLQPMGIEPDPSLGWGDFLGKDLNIRQIPGHHTIAMVEPIVRITSKGITEDLERANKQQAIKRNGMSEVWPKLKRSER